MRARRMASRNPGAGARRLRGCRGKAHDRPFRSKTCGLRPTDIVVDASQRDECRRNVAPFKYLAIPRGALLAARRPTSRRFRMGLKRLCKLTLPVFLLVGGGSAAEALTPPY